MAGPTLFQIPELVDRIVDHLYNDKVTLQTTALVSKRWVHASQYHIFSTVSASGYDPISKLFHRLESSPLQCTFVTELELWNCPTLLLSQLFRITHSCPHITRLGLKDTEEELNTYHPPIPSFSPASSSITHLTLGWYTFTHLADVLHLLAAFPGLSSLRLLCCQTGQGDHDPRVARPRLRRLRVDGPLSYTSGLWLLRLLDPGYLTHYNIQLFDSEFVPESSVTAMWRVPARSVEHLRLRVALTSRTMRVGNEVQLPVPDLQMPHLTDLKLVSSSRAGRATLDFMLRGCLLSMHAPKLENVTLDFLECTGDTLQLLRQSYQPADWTLTWAVWERMGLLRTPGGGDASIQMLLSSSWRSDNGLNEFRRVFEELEGKSLIKILFISS